MDAKNLDVDGHRQRWQKEAEFFDSEEYVEGPIPAETVRRYVELKKPFLPAEHPFGVLGDVKGKRILELGCGDGGNAILLALKGAEVYGIDISSRAIEVAKKRAALHGVSENVHFECSPLELYQPADSKPFDIICGFAVLHHLLPVLDMILIELKRNSSPGTVFLFTEPISMWKWLRKLRLALPIKAHGTPDERPLEPQDFVILRQHLPDLHIRYFGAVIRIAHRFLSTPYERSSAGTQFIYDRLAAFDSLLLNTLGVRGLASSATIYTK